MDSKLDESIVIDLKFPKVERVFMQENVLVLSKYPLKCVRVNGVGGVTTLHSRNKQVNKY